MDLTADWRVRVAALYCTFCNRNRKKQAVELSVAAVGTIEFSLLNSEEQSAYLAATEPLLNLDHVPQHRPEDAICALWCFLQFGVHQGVS